MPAGLRAGARRPAGLAGQPAASGVHVVQVVLDLVDEVLGQGLDGEGRAVAAVPRAAPLVGSDTGEERPRRVGGVGQLVVDEGRVLLGVAAPHRRLATAHDLREIGRANRLRAAAILLSPVHATATHPGAKPLGPVRFLLLAKRARMPVIALGGMTEQRFRSLQVYGWAAIDGLACVTPRLAAKQHRTRELLRPPGDS